MRLNAMRICLMGAVMLSPIALRAQDPNMPPMPTNAPGTSPTPGSAAAQQTPGVKNANSGAYGTDSSANGAGGPDLSAIRDKVFVHDVVESGFVEVRLGALAAQKANSPDVKKFGQQIVNDRTLLNDSMKPIAADLGISIPTKMNKAGQAEYDKLNALSGPDFDKEYLLYMVQDHRNDLKEFRGEYNAVSDPALKDAIMRVR